MENLFDKTTDLIDLKQNWKEYEKVSWIKLTLIIWKCTINSRSRDCRVSMRGQQGSTVEHFHYGVTQTKKNAHDQIVIEVKDYRLWETQQLFL